MLNDYNQILLCYTRCIFLWIFQPLLFHPLTLPCWQTNKSDLPSFRQQLCLFLLSPLLRTNNVRVSLIIWTVADILRSSRSRGESVRCELVRCWASEQVTRMEDDDNTIYQDPGKNSPKLLILCNLHASFARFATSSHPARTNFCVTSDHNCYQLLVAALLQPWWGD